MLNPTRMRIIKEFSKKPNITATELCEKIKDIPRTTMYRHINALINNILSVVSEKIRGSLKRTLSLNLAEITKHNNIESADKNSFTFLITIYSKFHNYFSNENADPVKDKLFLNNAVLMMSDSELKQFLDI